MQLRIYTFLVFTFACFSLFAHSSFHGKVVETITNQPVVGAVIQVVGQNKVTTSDVNGFFELRGLPSGSYAVKLSLIGYKPRFDTIQVIEDTKTSKTLYMEEDAVSISEITVTARKEGGLNSISSLDFSLRPHLTTQDLLRLVPGLFIAQHAGGGKAEQLFLRGFDVDHGTDVAVSVDNMPVNMVSQTHGQGYADLHFVIPETVERMNFAKGPYDAKTGDFNTAGAVQFQTKNYLPRNMFKAEAGAFNTYRGVTMLNLLNGTDTIKRKQNAYMAAEYFYTGSFFQNPQDFNRVNLFGKYTNELNSTTNLAFTLSSLRSNWNASGEIPDRAVRSGLIPRYGSIDPSEGGNTSRINANLTLNKKLDNHATIQSNLYYIKYLYNLYSNFTLFKEDSINGDQINQSEERNVLGYNGSYTKETDLGKVGLKSTIGIGLRDDQIDNIALSHTRKRAFLNDISRGDIHETNFNAYLDETFYFSPRLSLNLGLRYDHFYFSYRNRLVDTVNDVAFAQKGILSPKLNVYYNVTSNLQFYVSAGSGFHSNDARVAVVNPGNILPRAISADFGTNLKIGKSVFFNAAVWAMDLESEYVWVGDEGLFEPSGRTRRVGLDLSARVQLLPWLFADGDLNLAQPKYLDEPEGQNYVPLAPPVTSVAGLNARTKSGFTASVRYRYLGKRAAVEDNTIQANDYFILDAVVGYARKGYQVGLTAENLLNEYWQEAAHATESRLQNEPAAVNEIHYTPGTPFNIRGNFTVFF